MSAYLANWVRFGAKIPFPKCVFFLALFWAATAHGATATPIRIDQGQAPTFYYYQGLPKYMELKENQLAVKLSKGSAIGQITAPTAQIGVGVKSATSTGIAGWYFLETAFLLNAAGAAFDKIEELLKVPGVEFASPVFKGEYDTWVIMTPHILLRFKPDYYGQSDAWVQSLAPGSEIANPKLGNMSGAYKIKTSFKNGFEVLGLANSLAVDPRLEWAEPDAQFSGGAAFIPNDPGFGDIWGIRNTGQFGGTVDMDMDGDSAWDITTGSASIKVLILDTGVDSLHPDINQLPGADFTGEGGNGAPVNPCDVHGTAVAGCVTAIINNSLGTVGIAPGCKVISARPFISSLSCDGSWSGGVSGTVDALAFGETQGCRVSNNSNYYGFTSGAIDAVYNSTYTNGMVHFAAAGNFSSSNITYPADIPIVNAIAALTPTGARAGFSNYGVGLDYSAPGTNVYTTDRTGANGYAMGDYTYFGGTSAASPYSAGVAALLLSSEPGLTSAQVEDRLKCTCKDLGAIGYETNFGWGFVNAENALLNLPETDPDGDSIGSQCDNCPTAYNPLQQNAKPGDANANGSNNLADLISDVNYLFNKTGWPACASNAVICWLSDLLCRGDWNGNGAVALDDVIRGVNYTFSKPGGPWNPLTSGVCCVPVP